MTNYSELVLDAIEKAHKEHDELENKTTIIKEHKNGVKTITKFYKKNKAIWCKMITGSIISDNRVYKVNTDKPYIREFGRYWYLGEREKQAISYLLK